MNHTRIHAYFEIVTPMFLGGADQQASRIRESSIKGALAFWWRALNFAGFIEEGDTEEALKALQEREQFLFGGPKGQGVFLLKVVDGPTDAQLKKGGQSSFNSGEKYLGYGLVKMNGVLERDAFAYNQEFALQIVFNRRCKEEDVEEVINALKLLGMLGGLGSRVRRGWGSVALKHIRADGEGESFNWSAPGNRSEYIARLREAIGSRRTEKGTNFELTALAAESDIRVGTTQDRTPLSTLNEIGVGMQRYRGWLKPGERNFLADHDWFKFGNHRPIGDKDVFPDSNSNTTDVASLPKRTVFGLPHNYFSPNDNGLRMDVSGPEHGPDRRASPLLIHVHKTTDGNTFGVLAHFPTRFLDSGRIKAGRREKAFKPDQSVITNFLDGNQPGGQRSPKGPYFPSEPLFK